MPLATCIQHLRVDPTAIVAHHNPKIPACILHFYFYRIRFCMPKCIYESLAADAVYLVPDRGSQRASVVVADDAITDVFIDGEFLPDTRESQLEVAAVVVTGSQATETASPLLGNPAHQLQYASQGGVRWGCGRPFRLR